MERRGIRSVKLAMLVSIVVLTAVLPQVAIADDSTPTVASVVIVDGGAVNNDLISVDVTTSFVGLLGTLQGNRSTTFINAADDYAKIGPFSGNDTGFVGAREEIEKILFTSVQQDPVVLFHALSEAHNIFGNTRAPRGSSVYLLSGSNSNADFTKLTEQLRPIVTKFGEKGWPVYGIALPKASESAVSFLTAIASMSGGRLHDLSTPEGFTKLTNSILNSRAVGSISEIGGGSLNESELLATSISVAPGTKETTLFFFKQDRHGSLSLSNPDGFEANTGDQSESYVLETPNAVIWKLVDPLPGNWRVDVRGIDGLLEGWSYSTNKYDVVLDSQDPLELDEPGVLISHIREGDKVAFVDDATIQVRITTPTGAMLVHEMNDDGVAGDAIASDGFHAVTLPSLATEGLHNLQLELSWPNFDHKISSQATFEVVAFPRIEVQMQDIRDLASGVRTHIATAFVHVRGETFPIDTSQFVVEMASPEEAMGTLEVEPKRLFGKGPASEYQVFFTPKDAAFHTLTFRLSMTYAGRNYIHSTNSLIVPSFTPPSVVEIADKPTKIAETVQVPGPIPAASVVAAAPTTPIQMAPLSASTTGESSIPQILLTIAGVALVIVLAIGAFLLTRQEPYGYLYNDRDEPLVNFSKLPRNPLIAFLYRGSVRGKELGIQGLEGIVFHFSRDRVRVTKVNGDGPTVRMNNEPLIDETVVEDKSWIGSGGKLYSFIMSPPSAIATTGGD